MIISQVFRYIIQTAGFIHYFRKLFPGYLINEANFPGNLSVWGYVFLERSLKLICFSWLLYNNNPLWAILFDYYGLYYTTHLFDFFLLKPYILNINQTI